MKVATIQNELDRLADPERAAVHQRFFKTGPGQYGEGDVFRGIRVPEIRKIAKKYNALILTETEALLQSPYHEDRLLALIILVSRFNKGDAAVQETVYLLYLANTHFINNWDLVDISAEHILGGFLRDASRAPLAHLAKSGLLWERRMAIMATFHFIRRHEFAETFRIAEILRNDREDLIHKAAGWMLREIGKRDIAAEERFLKKHYRQIPRTMLRYAIERFPEPLRQAYLQGKV